MVFHNIMMGAISQASAFSIDQSVRFNDSDSPQLSRTYTLDSPWTFSAWIKRGELGSENMILGSSNGEIHFNSDDTLEAEGTSSTAVFRDPGAWYHVHVSNNGLFVNGVSHGSLTTTRLNNQNLFDDFDGYAAEVHLQSGTNAYTNFGETNDDGVWVPQSVAAGDTYLKFANSSNFGVNTGDGGAWSASGFTTVDQMLDTPLKNYTTLNPLDQRATTYRSVALSNGNLDIDKLENNAARSAFGVRLNGGKWVYEATLTSSPDGSAQLGWSALNVDLNNSETQGPLAQYLNTGEKRISSSSGTGSPTTSSYGASFTNGDVIRVETNFNDSTIEFFKNNATQGSIDISGMNDGTIDYFPHVYANDTSVSLNFGQRSFVNTPTSGFKALNTANLAAPAITDGSTNFQTTLYIGNGSTQSINQSANSTFLPDFAWIKNRTAADSHALFDVTRGATKVLSSNNTAIEDTNADTLTGFESDGFALGDDVIVNTSLENYVAWQWHTQGGAGSSNTTGTINTTTTSVSQAAGISISTYTGTGSNATIGHGLGAAPAMIIIKRRDAANQWAVYHNGLGGNTKYLQLDSTSAVGTDATFWNSTSPTSTVFSIGTDNDVNASGGTYVAYAFASVPGFNAIGKYTGNANADGPFIFTGMRPAFVLVKEYTSVDDWVVWDTQRDPTNVGGRVLRPDNGIAEFNGIGGSRDIDILSNGFKWRSSNNTMNGDGSEYIFTAFAEHPFGGTGVSPITAR